LDEAESYYNIALQINPKFSSLYSNLLLLMNYTSKYDMQFVSNKHKHFAEQFEKPLAPFIMPHTNKPVANRCLKIGYISPDFRKQSVGFFIEPVLASHNHQDFEIFCYANLPVHDEMTERMKGYADNWRNIARMLDEEVTDLIHNDEIDILVDLAGHTAFNRLLVFARKPAPIQLTWIGYPNTTGLSSIDYRIVDNFTDPLGMTDQYYTEKLIRLPESFLCYLPYKDSPDVGELPALSKDYITFGSFNILKKITPDVIKLWSQILERIPRACLIIKNKSLADSMTRQYVLNQLLQQNISVERIELLSYTPTFKEHLEIYNRIDIGLDSFPYHGTTTTCEAMWMGVPVITLEGNPHASRVGVSLLSNVGLQELIALTTEEYIKIAVNLADDLKGLQSLRERLRDMMKHSPLCDAKRFTANLENCYRQIWEKWCKSV
jgi:predicted O-linked N-acetylglucosamine transferase (SPINDLY family)